MKVSEMLARGVEVRRTAFFSNVSPAVFECSAECLLGADHKVSAKLISMMMEAKLFPELNSTFDFDAVAEPERQKLINLLRQLTVSQLDVSGCDAEFTAVLPGF